MGAYVIGQVPLLDASRLVTGDELSLIRVDAYVVDCRCVGRSVSERLWEQCYPPGAPLS